MKEIKLNHGFVAIVDNNDYRHLNQFKWYAHKTHLTYYAKRAIYKNGKQEILLMHQIIVGKHKGLEIDHINHNGLDNRRCNLRTITHRENCLNRRKTNIS